MASFNDLIAGASNVAFNALGGVPCQYRRNGVLVNEQARVILDFDVLVPAENGMGYTSQIRAGLLVAEVGAVKLNDTFTANGVTYRVIALDGSDGIEANAFVRKV